MLKKLFTRSTPTAKMNIADAGNRYNQWTEQLKKCALFPIEHLLPTIEIPCPNTLPELMASGNDKHPDLSDAYLTDKIRQLSPWGYGIQLRPNVITEKRWTVSIERMIYRSHLISGAVRKLLGNTIFESSILDLACNHGYFSTELAFHGAKRAHGVDLRQENIDKAHFISSYFNVDNTLFSRQDIYDLDDSERYDVVLNLGLFYHITDPYRLMELTFNKCRKFAVIDSIMHKEPVSAFIQRVNKDSGKHAEGKYSVELHPTYRAIIDLMHAVGFKDIVEVVPEDSSDRAKHELYDRSDRRCLIGFK